MSESGITRREALGLGLAALVAAGAAVYFKPADNEELKAEIQKIQVLQEAQSHLTSKVEYPDGTCKSFTVVGDYDAKKLAELREALRTEHCKGYDVSFEDHVDPFEYARMSSTHLRCRQPGTTADAPTK